MVTISGRFRLKSFLINTATFHNSTTHNRLDHARIQMSRASGIILYFSQALNKTFLNFVCVDIMIKGRGINSHTLARKYSLLFM